MRTDVGSVHEGLQRSKSRRGERRSKSGRTTRRNLLRGASARGGAGSASSRFFVGRCSQGALGLSTSVTRVRCRGLAKVTRRTPFPARASRPREQDFLGYADTPSVARVVVADTFIATLNRRTSNNFVASNAFPCATCHRAHQLAHHRHDLRVSRTDRARRAEPAARAATPAGESSAWNVPARGARPGQRHPWDRGCWGRRRRPRRRRERAWD